MFIDRVYRLPRLWANDQLARFAPLFDGHVVNVSAWRDEDKDGRHYRDYFTAAASYEITNYKAEARGLQGVDGEIYLDLAQPLDANLADRWDLVFNHTTLEHVYDLQMAFANLCRATRDVVVLVVPFLQPFHADYGDYWRMSPLAVSKAFATNGLETLYCNYNTHKRASVYVFAIASKQPHRWREPIHAATAPRDSDRDIANDHAGNAGARTLTNRGYRARERIRKILGV